VVLQDWTSTKILLKRYKYVRSAFLQKTNTHAFEMKQFNGDFNSYTWGAI